MKPDPGPLAPSLRSLLDEAARQLTDSGVDSPRLSAEVLLAAALGLERDDLLTTLLLTPDARTDRECARRFAALAARRAGGEPVAYLTGVKEFYGRDFAVGPGALVPRPESEGLVDRALAFAARREPGLFADFGTGSGCLAVTLALELPAWRGLALEKSPAALAFAVRNTHRHKARLALARADFLRPPLPPASLDLLIANPPYVSDAEYAALDREVRDFEPKSALVPEAARAASGAEAALGIIALAEELLKPGGLLLMEMGHTQGGALLMALGPSMREEAAVHADMAGLDRILSACKRR